MVTDVVLYRYPRLLAAALSSSPAVLQSSMTRSCSMRSVPSMPAGGLDRSLATTHSDGKFKEIL
jgi:hypothetical protein